ncbi:MAG: ice-binding family protein [Candidatus Bathyarchaeia archaeon]
MNKIILNKKIVGTIFVLGLLLLATGIIAVKAAPTSSITASSVNLGSAQPFAVFAYSGISNAGPMTVVGDVGISTGYTSTAITGDFSPLTVDATDTFSTSSLVTGQVFAADYTGNGGSTPTLLTTVAGDISNAYTEASNLPSSATYSDLSGLTLTPGVYVFTSANPLTGTLTLNGEGNPNAVFVFQCASTLITASSSVISYIGDTQPCNVIWQVGSSATLGSGSTFVGTILAYSSIGVGTTATVDGRAFALNGAVTLNGSTINNTTGQMNPPFPLPESALGALMAIGVSFAAFGIVKMKARKTLKR